MPCLTAFGLHICLSPSDGFALLCWGQTLRPWLCVPLSSLLIIWIQFRPNSYPPVEDLNLQFRTAAKSLSWAHFGCLVDKGREWMEYRISWTWPVGTPYLTTLQNK